MTPETAGVVEERLRNTASRRTLQESSVDGSTIPKSQNPLIDVTEIIRMGIDDGVTLFARKMVLIIDFSPKALSNAKGDGR